ALLEDLGITGGLDQIHRLPAFGEDGPATLALVGMGSAASEEDRVDVLRYTVGSAVRQLAGVGSVVVDLPTDSVEEVAGIAEGVAYGAFTDRGQRTEASAVKDPVADAVIMSEVPAEEATAVLSRA